MPHPSATKREVAKKLALATASLLLSILAVLVGLKLYARWMGIRDPAFVYENQLSMWQRDDDIGYINKPGFSAYCFGTVHVQTNAQGFRGPDPTPKKKRPGTTRVVAMGDSVMWGTSVQEVDSIPGVLRAMLGRSGNYEVINAAVVGYSTFQELQFLEKHVLPLHPDIVLVNFCINDYLPNEDPFGNLRDIYLDYLHGSLDKAVGHQGDSVEELITALETGDSIWDVMKSLSPQRHRLILNVLIEGPMTRMAEHCRAAGVPLVYVFIPPRFQDGSYRTLAGHLQSALTKAGAAVVDVSSMLSAHGREVPDITESGVRPSGLLRDLYNIVLLRRIEEVHRTNNYIDQFHPTMRGNRIIAEQLHRYFTNRQQVVSAHGERRASAP